MNNIKDIILKLKIIANLNSNIELARYLNISYNTLNTWIKREKIPQEVLLNFCIKNNCSLDYLLLDKEKKEDISSQITQNNEIIEFDYFGSYKKLKILNKATLLLNKTILHNNSYYLILLEQIYSIANVKFDIFSKQAIIKIFKDKYSLTIENFKEIKIGLIVEVIN